MAPWVGGRALHVVVAILALTALRARLADAAPFASPAMKLPAIAAESYQLANGLTVVMSPDPSQPVVAVSVWYRVGCGNEAPGKSGMAHLLEHLMFAGSQHTHRNAFLPSLASQGATNIDGTTREDRTEFAALVPKEALELALWLESDRMQFLPPMLTAAAVENNKEIIRNELRLKLQTRAYGPSVRALGELVFPVGHPFRPTCFGYLPDIERIELPEVRTFYETWYRPSNATLVLAGDIDVADTKALVAKYFGGLARKPKPNHATLQAPAKDDRPRRATIQDRSGEARVVTLAWIGPGVGAPGNLALTALASHISSPRTSWFYHALVATNVATAVQASHMSFANFSMFKLELQLPDTTAPALAEAQARIVMERYRRELVPERHLRWQLMETTLATIDALGTPLRRATLLQASAMYFGDVGAWRKTLDEMAILPPMALRDAAAAVLTNDAAYVLVTEPGA